MPISDLGSYVITGQEFLAHWSDVDADRTAQTQPAFTLPDGYAAADLTADVAAVQAAITDQEGLQNGVTIATAVRDAARNGVRNRVVEFRKVLDYRLKGSGYDQSLPDTPHAEGSEQKMLKALDDVANLWMRVNAASGLPNFTPPLLLLGGYALAGFQADVTALRAKFLAVTTAEHDARIGRKTRDLLLDPLRDRLVQYRQGIEIEYGEQHLFTQTLPDVYENTGGTPGGGGPAAPGQPTLTAGSNGQIVVTWTGMAGVLYFKVYRKIEGTDLEYVFAGQATGSPMNISNLPPGETVRVRITAVNANGESQPGLHAEIVVA